MRPRIPARGPRRRAPRAAPRRLIAAAVAALLLSSCAQPQLSALQQIRQRGELRVVTLNAPTSYYLGAHGPQGFEYRLANAFAQQLQVALVIEPVADAAAMRAALSHGRADIAAAQISADAQWLRVGLPTANYEQVAQLVVQVRGKPRPRDVTGLGDCRVMVRADSPQLELLRSIRDNGIPDLSWTVLTSTQAGPLELLDSGAADFAVVDANEFEFEQHLYPETVVAFALPDTRPLQWIVRAGAADLAAAANEFFGEAKASGLMARIEQDAGRESREFDYEEAHRLQAEIATRLPELQALFEQAAQATGLDWRLLAAVGYQESRWQMQAVSSEGALGVMMLTTDAASAVGVTDRTDLQQNILGGARYLAQVIDTIPDRIAEPDRTWLALAAYNVGYGHLEDARVLAQIRGKNPDLWRDVREQLPLLAQEQWYSRVKRGYARGWEPARFVEQVRQYLAVLEWQGTVTVARDQRARAAPPAPPSAFELRRYE